MFKVSAVPPRMSAMLTVFRGATAINDGTTAEPLRPWRCNYGLCRTSTAVAPRLRCDGGRRSAVMTILRDATAINDGTTAIMAVSLRNHGDNGGATGVYAVQAQQWYRASGVTGVLVKFFQMFNYPISSGTRMFCHTQTSPADCCCLKLLLIIKYEMLPSRCSLQIRSNVIPDSRFRASLTSLCYYKLIETNVVITNF